MSKQVKIFLIAGIVVIVAFAAYLLWPAGEPDAPQRGVTLDTAEESE